MRNIPLVVLILILSNIITAQNCIEIEDPITKEKTVEYKQTKENEYIHLENKYHGSYLVYFKMTKNQTTFTFPAQYSSALQQKIPIGTEVIFKLENGEIIKLKTNSELLPEVKSTIDAVFTVFKYSFDLTKDDINKFAASKMTLIRFPKVSSEGSIDLDKENYAFSKASKKLLEGANCMLSHLSSKN